LKANISLPIDDSPILKILKILKILIQTFFLLTASGETNVELATGQSFQAKFTWSFVYEKFNNDWKVIFSHQARVN
jgi:hypothetical protein